MHIELKTITAKEGWVFLRTESGVLVAVANNFIAHPGANPFGRLKRDHVESMEIIEDAYILYFHSMTHHQFYVGALENLIEVWNDMGEWADARIVVDPDVLESLLKGQP